MRRLLHALTASGAPVAQRLHWSRWRRAHQARARCCHHARRARTHPPPAAPAVPVVAVPGTPALTDGRRGKQWRDHQRVLAGILWVMHTGASWREVPAGFGAWQTGYDWYRRWRRDGIWDRIRAVLMPSAATV